MNQYNTQVIQCSADINICCKLTYVYTEHIGELLLEVRNSRFSSDVLLYDDILLTPGIKAHVESPYASWTKIIIRNENDDILTEYTLYMGDAKYRLDRCVIRLYREIIELRNELNQLKFELSHRFIFSYMAFSKIENYIRKHYVSRISEENHRMY